MSEKNIPSSLPPLPELLNSLGLSSVFPHAVDVADAFSSAAHFLVAGGFVRDVLLKQNPKDLDFATNLHPDKIIKILEDKFAEQIKISRTDQKNEGTHALPVVRVRFFDTEEYEIATFRKDLGVGDGRKPATIETVEDPAEDAQRRDFTINALFYDPRDGSIIDHVGGLQDLADKKLRFVGEAQHRLQEDLTRGLRYIRFLFKTGFAEDPSALQAIQDLSEQIATQPGERISNELMKTLQVSHGRFGEIIETYDRYGLLNKILPEVSDLKNCEQGPLYHMEGNAYVHTVLVANGLPAESSAELALAAILHDIAKLQTRGERTDEQGRLRVSFFGHAALGAEMARKRLNALRLSGEQIAHITFLIGEHIRAFDFRKMGRAKAVAWALNPHAADVVNLAQADIAGSIPVDDVLKQQNQELSANIKN